MWESSPVVPETRPTRAGDTMWAMRHSWAPGGGSNALQEALDAEMAGAQGRDSLGALAGIALPTQSLCCLSCEGWSYLLCSVSHGCVGAEFGVGVRPIAALTC